MDSFIQDVDIVDDDNNNDNNNNSGEIADDDDQKAEATSSSNAADPSLEEVTSHQYNTRQRKYVYLFFFAAENFC